MALSKPSLLTHLKTLTGLHKFPLRAQPTALRSFSFSTPEEAAAERRRRKRLLRMEPPLSSLSRPNHQSPPTKPNPNAPKLPEPVSELSGKRLDLHNKILKLIRENDLEEAALYTRHSVYSNCRPTIFTVNAVLTALLRQSKYADLVSLHRFITQAGIAPNVITHNLLFQTYLDCRRPDTALEYFKQMLNDAPFNPAPSSYRIMIKGLVDNGRVEKAFELLGDMVEVKMFSPDPLVYYYLMLGCAREGDADGVFRVFEEFKGKLGGGDAAVVEDGVIYGGLMRGYFLKGMEKEAMECYESAVGEGSRVRMNDVGYNAVLDALVKNGKFDEGMRLFDRMLGEHDPPRHLSVNLGSFNVMVDGYCARGSFSDAVEVFRKMGGYRCSPDTLSFNNLIEQLCKNGLLSEAREVYGEMDGKGVKPDEFTFGLLMDTCFKEGRTDDGVMYFQKMVDLGLRPNLAVYGRLVDQLVKVGRIDEAKSFYDLMVKKLKMDDASYKFMMGAFSDAGRLDDLLKMVGEMLDDESIEFNEELQEFVKGELRKEGREEDLSKLMEEKERQKAEAKAREAEAAEAAKRSVRAAVASLLPSKLFGKKEEETESVEAKEDAVQAASSSEGMQTGKEVNVEKTTVAESNPADSKSNNEVIKAESPVLTEAKSDSATEQQVSA